MTNSNFRLYFILAVLTEILCDLRYERAELEVDIECMFDPAYLAGRRASLN